MDTAALAAAQRRLFDRFGLEADSRFVALDGPVRRAHVLETGEGPAILLVHGGGSFAGHWAPLLPHLDGHRLIAVDRPGHGLTDPFLYARDTDVRTHAVDFLDGVLDALGLEDVLVVGNSMGGLWSFWLALDRPRRVRAMVQLGCPAVLLETGAPLGLRLVTTPVLGKWLLALEPPSPRQVRTLFSRLGDRSAAERPPELVEAFVEAERLFAPAWLSLLDRFTGPLARRDVSLGEEELRAVGQSVHFVWGEHDPFGRPDVGRRATELLRDASIDVLPTGHMPWLERPEEVGAIVRGFAARHASLREPIVSGSRRA